MKQGKRVTAAVAAVALASVAFAPLGGSAATTPPPKPVKVTLKDSFYTPSKISQKKGGQVVWKWSNANNQSHNVTLVTAPNGVVKKKFRSNTASTQFTFKKTFKVKGNYHFECTIHPTTMQMDLKVK